VVLNKYTRRINALACDGAVPTSDRGELILIGGRTYSGVCAAGQAAGNPVLQDKLSACRATQSCVIPATPQQFLKLGEVSDQALRGKMKWP
jgi:hypothetical protein